MQIVNGHWQAILDRTDTLDLLYPPFKTKMLEGIKIAHEAEIPVRIFETYRSRPRQGELWKRGRTKGGNVITNAKPGESMHNYGLAADLVMYVDGRWTWEPTELYKKLGPIMESVGLRWYGRNRRFKELVHYQLAGLPDMYVIQQLYKKYGIEGVWLMLNQNKKQGG